MQSVAGRGGFIPRQEEHSHTERLIDRQRDARLAEQKATRNGSQDADAIAALAIGGDGAAVSQTSQRRERQPQDVVIGRAAQSRNKSDSARLMVKARIYESSAPGANQARSHI